MGTKILRGQHKFHLMYPNHLSETKDMGLEMIPSYFTPNKTIFYVDLTEPNSKPEQQKNPEIIA